MAQLRSPTAPTVDIELVVKTVVIFLMKQAISSRDPRNDEDPC